MACRIMIFPLAAERYVYLIGEWRQDGERCDVGIGAGAKSGWDRRNRSETGRKREPRPGRATTGQPAGIGSIILIPIPCVTGSARSSLSWRAPGSGDRSNRDKSGGRRRWA